MDVVCVRTLTSQTTTVGLPLMSVLTGHTTSLVPVGALATIGDMTAPDASTDTMEKTAVSNRHCHLDPSSNSLMRSGGIILTSSR